MNDSSHLTPFKVQYGTHNNTHHTVARSQHHSIGAHCTQPLHRQTRALKLPKNAYGKRLLNTCSLIRVCEYLSHVQMHFFLALSLARCVFNKQFCLHFCLPDHGGDEEIIEWNACIYRIFLWPLTNQMHRIFVQIPPLLLLLLVVILCDCKCSAWLHTFGRREKKGFSRSIVAVRDHRPHLCAHTIRMCEITNNTTGTGRSN